MCGDTNHGARRSHSSPVRAWPWPWPWPLHRDNKIYRTPCTHPSSVVCVVFLILLPLDFVGCIAESTPPDVVIPRGCRDGQATHCICKQRRTETANHQPTNYHNTIVIAPSQGKMYSYTYIPRLLDASGATPSRTCMHYPGRSSSTNP